MGKRIYRSRTDRMIAGICGGLADYLGVDATIIRLVWVLLLLPGGLPGLIPYVVCWIIVPEQPVGQADQLTMGQSPEYTNTPMTTSTTDTTGMTGTTGTSGTTGMAGATGTPPETRSFTDAAAPTPPHETIEPERSETDEERPSTPPPSSSLR